MHFSFADYPKLRVDFATNHEISVAPISVASNPDPPPSGKWLPPPSGWVGVEMQVTHSSVQLCEFVSASTHYCVYLCEYVSRRYKRCKSHTPACIFAWHGCFQATHSHVCVLQRGNYYPLVSVVGPCFRGPLAVIVLSSLQLCAET